MARKVKFKVTNESVVSYLNHLIDDYGDGQKIETFDFCSNGLELEGSTIDKIEKSGDTLLFYYNENTGDCDDYREFELGHVSSFAMCIEDMIKSQKNVDERINAIDRFICEANNFESVLFKSQITGHQQYVPRFIVEAKWTCNVDHMVDKWNDVASQTDTYGYFVKFYCEMDTANKEAMCDWILANRKNGYIRK